MCARPDLQTFSLNDSLEFKRRKEERGRKRHCSCGRKKETMSKRDREDRKSEEIVMRKQNPNKKVPQNYYS